MRAATASNCVVAAERLLRYADEKVRPLLIVLRRRAVIRAHAAANRRVFLRLAS
jgi:hypothetical protein